jgi:hypothetical protein
VIPRRAIFFWEGGEMPWLRAQSIETFRALNPSWDVDIIDGSGLPIEPTSRLEIVQRSDWARYRALHEGGGVYFDTDIMFLRPFPDEWLNYELILSKYHIAMMGSTPGEPFFEAMCLACRDLASCGAYASYQNYGIHLLQKLMTSLIGRSTWWYDIDVVLPILWDHTENLWNDWKRGFPPLTLGVHWFGGDPLSQKVEQLAGPEWGATSNCIVAQAWRRALEGARAA